MTPTPQEYSEAKMPKLSAEGERMVISGVAGLYPNCESVNELSDLLYNKENPIGKPRWEYDHPEATPFCGKIPQLDKFDASFFFVNTRLANVMDYMSKKLLEQTYQAILDAGVNPQHLNDQNVGVFMGSCFSETEKIMFYDSSTRTGLGIPGCSKAMFANRISYWLNTKGPSMGIDAGCCSSMVALEQAYLAMERGECDSAIVGGSYLCMHPQGSVHFGRIVPLAKDGKTRSFCEDAEGCALAEAINVIFLQRAKDAKRIYAEVVHVKSQFGLSSDAKAKNNFNRDPAKVASFLKTFYDEAKVPPQAVEYVEAFGSAKLDADKAELEAIGEVFCKNRTNPLLVGSVMSNIGYNEAASGISAITKVLIGYQKGELSANLHCDNPRRDIAALQEGRMRIVTEHEPFQGLYAGVNNFSLTGINSHVLLKGYYKPKDNTRYKSSIPRLVTVSGRHESAVEKILKDLKSRPVDPEEIALLHNFHEERTNGHMARGYTILDTNEAGETVCLSEKKEHFDDAPRPLWFVYSGMGSQWPAMGAQLMRIPTFADAIQRCQKVLEPKGVDLINIITSPDKRMFDNILHSFVGIAAVQIGLTDVLREMGIVPDMVIGHSVGELGCGYADGCFTAEEMIMAAYSRGVVSVETKFIRGSMAAVGIGYQQISKLIPPEIQVACHNSSTSSTISGPAEVMKEFVAKLTAQGIFAKEVPCSNIAYHSRYIAEAGPKLRERLNEVIKSPKLRSKRWVSTSLTQDRWNEPEAKYSSAWYHTNNLLSPVLFEETSRLIPANAVVVEVAPHGLLQAILKRSLSPNCRNIALTKRGHSDNALFMLEAIGSLFMEGYNPKIQALYPQVEFPVSTSTPMLSHLVEWAHNDNWAIPVYVSTDRNIAAVCNFVISVHNDEHNYLKGHEVRGRTCYPFAASLVAVWDTLAMLSGVPRKKISVQFREVHLFAQPPLHEQRLLRLRVSLHRGSGLFEVTDEFSRVATGIITAEANQALGQSSELNDNLLLDSEDIYQMLRERDYSYRGEFQSIFRTNALFTQALLLWENNWETLLDGMLQLHVLRHAHDTVSLPSFIDKIDIDVTAHDAAKTVQDNNKTLMPASVSTVHNLMRCGGIVLENVMFYDLPVATHTSLELKNVVTDAVQSQETMDNQVASDRSVALQIAEPGDLSSLRWVETPDTHGPGNTVTVIFAGLNDMDAKRATGVVPFKHEDNSGGYFGMDFSGITESGERVMGAARAGAASARVRPEGALLWPVPAHWSLEDAATVPCAYVQAFYCFGIRCQLLPGMTVLVHGGAGALGQAAIAVALANDCEVFTTVSNLNKKKFLLKLFPDIKDDHIGNSRDISFGDMVLRATRGKGCDIILDNVSGNLKNITLTCSAFCGVTINTNVVHSEENFLFGLNHLTKQRSYVTVDISSIFENPEAMKKVQLMVSEGIVRGYVRPLSRVTYAPQDAARAFRLLAASRHRGRALLKLRDAAASLPAQPRISCSPESCQVVLCDKGSFGVRWANRLVRRGAKKLYLHCAQPSAYLNLKVKSWEEHGLQVELSSKTLSNNSDAAALLNDCVRMGPVEGIYVVTSEGPGVDVSSVITCLDSVSRTLCPKLKYFAVLGAVDNMVQQTCLNRVRDQLPATALHLSPLYTDEAEGQGRGALDAGEAALRAARPGLRVQARRAARRPLLQDIADVAGIKIPADVSETTTLNDLLLDDSKSEAISAFLFNNYNVSLVEDEIPSLTIQKIQELDEYITEPKLKEVKGLGTFFSKELVSTDELYATTEIVYMPTHVQDVDMENLDIDFRETHLCIVPGMEGHHGRFRTLCESLKLRALVLQPGLDHPDETLQETAHRYAEILSTKAVIGNNFYLLGYESGVIVALELAAILESRGLVGTVFCVGTTPAEIRAVVCQQLRDLGTGSALEDAIALHFGALVTGADAAGPGLESAVRDAATWPQKLDAVTRALEGRVRHSLQFTRALLEAARARLYQVQRYDARPPLLRSRIVQLHSSASRDAPLAGGTRDMQQCSRQPVVTCELRVPLAHAAGDPLVSAIINRNIDAAILNEFNIRNLCEIYTDKKTSKLRKVQSES